MSAVELVLQVLGAAYALKLLVTGATFIWQSFLKSGVNLKKYRDAGDWAVVTGATDGIGRAYAAALAAKGFNVLIVSRTQEKLDNMRVELQDRCPNIQVRTHRLDFTQLTDANVEEICSLLRGMQVGVLVNNVAVNVEMPTYFDELPMETVRNIITCNTLGTAALTHAVLPQMKGRKRGVIVNLSSIGGTVPSAMLQPYGCTKAFVENFSLALAEETQRCGRRGGPLAACGRGVTIPLDRGAGMALWCSATCPTLSRRPWPSEAARRRSSRSRATLSRRR